MENKKRLNLQKLTTTTIKCMVWNKITYTYTYKIIAAILCGHSNVQTHAKLS